MEILEILVSEQKRQNEINLDVLVAHITEPKIVVERTGKIEDVTDFVRLLVNVVNNCAAWADFDTMKVNGSPHLLCGLVMNFILMVNGDFTTWMGKRGEVLTSTGYCTSILTISTPIVGLYAPISTTLTSTTRSTQLTSLM